MTNKPHGNTGKRNALQGGSLVNYDGEAPEIGSMVTAVLKNPDGSVEMLRAEVLAIWEEEQ